jgi:3-deoxy-7-phosphoheptulonate synthase
LTILKHVQDSLVKAGRKFRPQDSVITLNADRGTDKNNDFAVEVGGGHFMMIAGPCVVESPEQITTIATAVKDSGAQVLRGGAFKPRTSPYAFQGMQEEGIELLKAAGKDARLPVVSEIVDLQQLPSFEGVDIIQVGARNMQNFSLLRGLAKIKKPILLKRGFAATIEELLMSAEYLMAGGNEEVILCERGVRSFEPLTHNSLDLSAIPIIKELSHLPVIVDPSHATGVARYVRSLSLAAVAAGADGLLIEVHNNPKTALCDGQQSITPEEFDSLAKDITALRAAIGHCDAY